MTPTLGCAELKRACTTVGSDPANRTRACFPRLWIDSCAGNCDSDTGNSRGDMVCANSAFSVEEAQPLDVIVMQVAEEDVHDRLTRALHQIPTESDDARAGVEYECVVVGANFDT